MSGIQTARASRLPGWALAALLALAGCGGGGGAPRDDGTDRPEVVPAEVAGPDDGLPEDPGVPADPGPADAAADPAPDPAGDGTSPDTPDTPDPSDAAEEVPADLPTDGSPDAPAGPLQLKLMTFNLRTAFGSDGEDAWEFRRERVFATIRDEAPDVLGTQEGWSFVLDEIGAAVPEYQYAGISRTGSDVDEYTAVFWRTDRFDRLEDGTFWLSPTPDVPSSVFSENQLCPRIATWVRLAPRGGGEPFVVMNTHLDTTDLDDVKAKSAALLVRKLAEVAPAGPAFLTGDFNSSPGSAAWRILTGAETLDGTSGDLLDGWVELGHPEEGTFHGFTGTAGGGRIDWILHRPGSLPLAEEIVKHSFDGRYPSDHFPVVATIEVHDPPPKPAVIPLFDRVRISSWGEDEHFQKADVEFAVPPGPFQSVRLVADLETSCYPFSQWQSNPPPEGQNWPADCDAFDRNYEFTLDDPQADGDPPAIELVRAITPFGGPLHLDVDVTDVVNARPGTHRMRVVIPTWSDGAGQVSGSHGGWWVTARLQAMPGTPPRKVLAVTPLWNGVLGAGPDPAPVSFEIPAGATGARIEYRATGHGGANVPDDLLCWGPAEEFCWRNHTMVVDGQDAATWTDLRRTDCTKLCTLKTRGSLTYCAENPCGAIGSVQAMRANWCPGSETPPRLLDVSTLAPGPHAFAFRIPGIAEGGIWRISAVLVATGP